MTVVNFSYCTISSQRQSVHFNTHEVEFSELDKFTCAKNFSPIIWNGGYRKSKNFLSADFAVIDIDGTMPLEEVMEKTKMFDDILVVSSKSHKSPFKLNFDGSKGKEIELADYLHVMILFPEPITDLKLYQSVVKKLIALFNGDTSCTDGARFFFGNPNQIVFKD